MFYVYKISFNNSKKVYIGYTCKSISKRLEQHIQLANAGGDTKLQRAIRKYGIENLSVQKVYQTDDKGDAMLNEKRLIEQYDSFRNGYNMTLGGDGGWCVPDEKYDEWKISISKPFEANGRWSGYSDDQIATYFKEDYDSHPIGWSFRAASNRIRSMHHKFPRHLAKCRFVGFDGQNGNQRLIDYMCKKFNISREQLEYQRTDEHNLKLSKNWKKPGQHWYYHEDLRLNKQTMEDLTLVGWKKGRKLKWD